MPKFVLFLWKSLEDKEQATSLYSVDSLLLLSSPSITLLIFNMFKPLYGPNCKRIFKVARDLLGKETFSLILFYLIQALWRRSLWLFLQLSKIFLP